MQTAPQNQNYQILLETEAKDWDAKTSSPVIVHILNTEFGIDYYHACNANETVTLEVYEKGTYEVSFISPINADGSMYNVPDTMTLDAMEKTDTASSAKLYSFTKVDAKDVTKEQLTKLASEVAEAIKRGDKTLAADAGTKVMETVKNNAKANKNVDAAAIDEKAKKGEEAAKATTAEQAEARTKANSDTKNTSAPAKSDGAQPAQKPVAEQSGNKGTKSDTNGSKKPAQNTNTSGSGTTSTSNNKPSSNGGNSSVGGQTTKPEQPKHEHNWVAQYKTAHHDAQYKTVHHDAVYETRHHDAVTETKVICNACGATFNNVDVAIEHGANKSIEENDHSHSYSVKPVEVQPAWDEQVLVQKAWDEQVQTAAAWDEQVPTGTYKCSGCGATK